MDRRLDNIFIVEKGQGLNYTPPGSGGGTKNYPPSIVVQLSYDLECEPEDEEMIELSKIISRERNPALKEALEDLDEFLCG